jgi:hypothetical protein
MEARPDDEVFPWDAGETGFERLVDLQKRACSAPSSLRKKSTRRPVTHRRRGFVQRSNESTPSRAAYDCACPKPASRGNVPHIDFIGIVKRSLRMAGVPVSFSQGFNKRERIAAGIRCRWG